MEFKLNGNEIKAVLNLNSIKRYEYFIKKIADLGFVWGLYKDGWALAGDEDDNVILPLWPAKEYALLCAKDHWAGYDVEPIDIHEFIDSYLDELKTNNIIIGIFYTPEDKGIITEHNKIREDITNELRKIE